MFFYGFVLMVFVHWIPAFETVQETLDRHAMWKTQPPKSPLSGGLVTQFPPDKGDLGGLGMTNIGFLHSLFRRNDRVVQE